jgi:hypothetical protein
VGIQTLSLRKQGTIALYLDSPHQVRGKLCFPRNDILSKRISDSPH